MTFGRESVAAVWDELKPLAYAQHAEVKPGWPFDLKRAAYEALETIGALAVFTMRSSGVLRGYAVFMVMDHQHMTCKMAYQDAMYVTPTARGYWSGMFLRWTDKQLKALGAEQVVRFVTQVLDYSRALHRLGYVDGDRMMIRRF